MKTILKILLITHIVSLLFVNIVAFKDFTEKETKRLNPLGKSFLINFKINSIPAFIKNTIGLYSNTTGTNRGYEFFSPNISNGSSKFIFTSENGKEIKVLKSIESKVKFLTATYYFNIHIFDEDMRNKLLASICSRIFTLNPLVNGISVSIKFSRYNKLNNSFSENYKISYEKILLSKIKRNKS